MCLFDVVVAFDVVVFFKFLDIFPDIADKLYFGPSATNSLRQ
jgi:hypothetical protein